MKSKFFKPDPMQPIEKQEFKNKLYQILIEYAQTNEDEILDLREFLDWLKTQ